MSSPTETPEPPQPAADPVGPLLVECMERLERGEQGAIETLCDTHPDLADELRERMGVLLQMGLVDRESDPETKFPERLGEFLLRTRLGGGGMGVVYEAEQEPLGRTVALKLIRPEHLYFPRARERFRRETEAVARLQHPSIVAIYTVGEERGIPYFAMEMIRGATLADVLAAASGRAPESLRAVDLWNPVVAGAGASVESSFHDADELFDGSWIDVSTRVVMRIAEALAHAHARGVLHRDIKPSNIAVTPDGRVVLLDFGLASTSVDVRMTHYGSVIGSILYMAPEQIQGQTDSIDERTDVYSLGVTLYELLTLNAPYSGNSADEVRSAIVEGSPPSIRARNRRVPRDLENVCSKAISTERGGRYASIADFARDLRNVLEHKAVSARPPGALARATRWVQRHPTGTATIGLAAALVIGLPLTLLLLQRSHSAELQLLLDSERGARAAADEARADADDERQRAQFEARDAEAVASFLVDLFAAADPKEARGRMPTADELLRRGIVRAGERLPDQPELRARLLERISESFAGLSLYSDAVRTATTAVGLRRTVHGDDDLRTARAVHLLGVLRGKAGLVDQGESQLREALDAFLCHLGPSAPETAQCRLDLALMLLRVRRTEEVPTLLDATATSALLMAGDGIELRENLASARAQAFALLQEPRQSERHALEALELHARRGAGPDPGYLESLALLGSAWTLSRRFEQAEGVLSECVDVARRLYGDDSAPYAEQLSRYALTLSQTGRVPEAAEDWLRSFEIERDTLGIDHPETLRDLQRFAATSCFLGQHQRAADEYESALRELELRLGPAHVRSLIIRWRLGDTYAAMGEFGEADRVLSEGLELGGATVEAVRPQLEVSLGNALRHEPQSEAAAEKLLLAHLSSDEALLRVEALHGLVCMALARGDDAQARSLAERMARTGELQLSEPRYVALRDFWKSYFDFQDDATEATVTRLATTLQAVEASTGNTAVEFREITRFAGRLLDASGWHETADALRARARDAR